jgi:hypothetical protein
VLASLKRLERASNASALNSYWKNKKSPKQIDLGFIPIPPDGYEILLDYSDFTDGTNSLEMWFKIEFSEWWHGTSACTMSIGG